MKNPKYIFLALALAGTFRVGAEAPWTPDAPGFLERARLMEQSADYAGQADQLYRFGELKEHLTLPHTSAPLTSLMRALLKNGELEAMDDVYCRILAQDPASPEALQARAIKADSYFFRGKYDTALSIYEEVPIGSLPSPAQEGTLFRKALCQVKLKQYRAAEHDFVKLKSFNAYRDVARFYLAYIYYCQEDYRQAMADFRSLPDKTALEMGADFYVAQMLFHAGRYKEVIDMEPQLLRAAHIIDEGDTEAWRLLGESAYALGDTASARLKLLKHIEMHPAGGELSALYILGITDYASGDYTSAMRRLTPVATLDDAKGQSAQLYLGQCAAKTGDYTEAAMHFDRAARMNYDSQVAETALYDYAAALAAGGNVPFGSATDLLEEFAAKYPDSPYAPVVDEYLAAGYYREHRYAEALDRIARIQHPSASTLKLKQQAKLAYGSDLLSAGRATEAKPLLMGAARGADAALATTAELWLADCLYKLKDYQSALSSYDSFLRSAPRNDSQRPLALYNKAYTLFQLGRYTQAIPAFDTSLKAQLPSSLHADAMLRLADCYNFTGNVKTAFAKYEEVISLSDVAARDYAMFQAANMLGVLGKNTAKADMLRRLLNERPQSSWNSAALAELAEAQQASGDLNGAKATISRLEREYPDSEQLRVASLNMADALADKGNSSEAISSYENIIRRWPTSRQALVASENLQSICTEQGELQRYLSFIRSVPGAPQPDKEKVARLAYQAAMNAVERNPRNLAPLQEFVDNYPSSADTPDALAELADSYRAAGNREKALDTAERILDDYPHSKGVPAALLIKGEILTANGNHAEASQVYSKLLESYGNTYARQAYLGLMNNAGTPQQKLQYANSFLSLPDLPAADREQALFARADALTAAGQYSEALQAYTSLASHPRSASGGKATVLAARIYLKLKKPGSAEKLLTEFTAGGCDSMYWLAQGYISLADALHAQGRTKLAIQYLEALSDNYKQAEADVRSDINSRLNQWK